MTNPPILTIDKEGAAGIIQTGKPEGLYMCESVAFPRIWTGVDSRRGRPVVKKHGTFPEVLTWFMTRGGIIKKGQDIKNRIHTGEREICIRKTTEAGIRVTGARIREWSSPYIVTEITGDGWGKNTIKPEAKRKKRRK